MHNYFASTYKSTAIRAVISTEEEPTNLHKDRLIKTLPTNVIQSDVLFVEMKIENKRVRLKIGRGAMVNVPPKLLTPATPFPPTLTRLRV